MTIEKIKELLDDLTCRYMRYASECAAAGKSQEMFQWYLRAGGVQGALNALESYALERMGEITK